MKTGVDHIIHGGDYNPDQWLKYPAIIDDDVRMMKKARINSATVGIFSWSVLEPEEGVYEFGWLDEVFDKLYENGIDVILATPSGARPAWMARKYPEVLRVEESGIRNEFGVRHNHCPTSPVYRKKVREIDRRLAERYGSHPALKMWHISNEYSGECHCELCQAAFREWLKERYHNDLEELNDSWWNGFWSHRITDWEQISSPKYRGENHVTALKLCWDRFVTDSHISFYENEIAPIRESTPGIPITTNFMRFYDRIDYQKFSKKVDVVSWDNYPCYDGIDTIKKAAETAFSHDMFRSMKGGKPFLMMESTPSVVNHRPVNRIPAPGTQTLTAVQAIAHGSDSVQYFQWRKSRGGHEKFHGAVVDHSGRDDTRVFREVSATGELLEKLKDVAGTRSRGRVAIVCDCENSRAVRHFCGYNNVRRDYLDECVKWYRPFWLSGVCADVIAMDDDFTPYDAVIAPFLYMLKNGTEERIEQYVRNGGVFVATYLFAVTDEDDLCRLGGLPAGRLKDVFGVIAEETDALPEGINEIAVFDGKEYKAEHVCDVIRSTGAEVLGEYGSGFYAGQPSVTVNSYGKGKAYYVAFRNDGELAVDFCRRLMKTHGIKKDTGIAAPDGVVFRKRGDFVFVMNFGDGDAAVTLDGEYQNVNDRTTVRGDISVKANGFVCLKTL